MGPIAPADAEDQVYAEITEQTTSGAVGGPDGQPLAGATGDSSHQYEEVFDVAKPAGSYQITLCEAYGVRQ